MYDWSGAELHWPQGTERLCQVSRSQRWYTDEDCLVAFPGDRAWSVRWSAEHFSVRKTADSTVSGQPWLPQRKKQHKKKKKGQDTCLKWRICTCSCVLLCTCAVITCCTVCVSYYSFPKIAGCLWNCWMSQLLPMYSDLLAWLQKSLSHQSLEILQSYLRHVWATSLSGGDYPSISSHTRCWSPLCSSTLPKFLLR